MRVLIDGYFLNKKRGLGRYVQELLYVLGNYPDSDIELYVLVPQGLQHSYIFEGVHRYVHYKKLPFPLWEQFVVPLIAGRICANVVHFPYNSKALVYNFLSVCNVVTVHDLIFLDKSNVLGGGLYHTLGDLYRRIIIKMMSLKKTRILTVSEESQEMIRVMLGCDSDVAYTSTEYLHAQTSSTCHRRAGPYVFHVGGASPHKNTVRVIRAFLESNLFEYQLVIAGVSHHSNLRAQFESDRIVFLDNVSDQEIASEYAFAKCVLFPSLREGYGLPILEAFMFSVPVVTSNIAPMSEIASNAAVLVDPESVDSIRDGLIRVLNSSELARELVTRGHERLKCINGYEMARQTISTYKRAIEGS